MNDNNKLIPDYAVLKTITTAVVDFYSAALYANNANVVYAVVI